MLPSCTSLTRSVARSPLQEIAAAKSPRQATAERFPAAGHATIVGLRLLTTRPPPRLQTAPWRTRSISTIRTRGRLPTSAVVVPAAFAVAEACGASGADVLTAIVLGSEIVTRVIGGSTDVHAERLPSDFGRRRLRRRGRRGTYLGLNAGRDGSRVRHRWQHGLGDLRVLGDGSTTKAMHAGWAAHCGIMATMLASAGGDGPAHVFEGRFGIFASHFRQSFDPLDDWELGTQ